MFVDNYDLCSCKLPSSSFFYLPQIIKILLKPISSPDIVVSLSFPPIHPPCFFDSSRNRNLTHFLSSLSSCSSYSLFIIYLFPHHPLAPFISLFPFYLHNARKPKLLFSFFWSWVLFGEETIFAPFSSNSNPNWGEWHDFRLKDLNDI